MRKILLITIFNILLATNCLAGGSILFNETDEYYTITDAADLTLPNADWTIGVYTKVNDNSGTAFQYLLSNGGFAAVNSFNLFMGESGQGANTGCWAFVFRDGDDGSGRNLDCDIVGTIPKHGADGLWRLVLIQRVTGSSEVQMWQYDEGDSIAVDVGSVSDANLSTVNGGDWNIGRRTDGNADRYYGNLAGYVFKGDRSFTAAEITELGTNPFKHIADMDIFVPLWNAGANEQDLTGNGHTITQNNAPGDSADGPPVNFSGGSK